MKKLLLLFFIITISYSKEIVVIAHISFPKNSLTQKEIKAIFLDKKHFIYDRKIFPINYEFNAPLRTCFEKSILKKSRRNLEIYWLKAHYSGNRPPKVVKSQKMLLEYLKNIHTAIGYGDFNLSSTDPHIKILYKGTCL